jgi:Tol biopolymer transport system component
VFQKGAAVVALAFLAGCSLSTSAEKTEPAQRHLVYERLSGEQSEQGVWIAAGDGGNARLLVPGGWTPSISPDGKWVAYERSCDASSVGCNKTYVVSTEPGARARALLAGIGGPIRWSPDSTRIVTMLSKDAEADELVSVDVASGKDAALARGRFLGWSVSPDGKQVVLALAHGQAPENTVFPIVDLYVTDIDGRGGLEQLTHAGDSAYPAWGPRSIAFAKLVPVQYPNPDSEFARNEIWRIQPDGTGRTPITGHWPKRLLKRYPHWHCIGLQPVDWSDDGSALLAEVTCEGIGQTVAVDPHTGAIRSLGAATNTVALSRDAQFALVQWGDGRVGAENEKVLIYPYTGGKPDVVSTGAAAPSWNR